MKHVTYFLIIFACMPLSFADESPEKDVKENGSATDTVIAPVDKKSAAGRDFYHVLEDIMGDVEFDIKNNQLIGLKDVSIRNISLSENIPTSFRAHLELLLAETILKVGKTRVLQCLACKSRKTVLEKNQVVVSSLATNQDQLSKIAKANGILNFIDAAFTLEPHAMVLSLSITDAEIGTIVWSKSYNSETSRIAAFRKGVDFSQIDTARSQTEYVPLTQIRAMVYVLSQPNIQQKSTVIALGLRVVERYNNRKSEVGFEFDYMASSESIVSKTFSSSQTDLYHAFSFNGTVLFLHAWNFIGDEENYNELRQSMLLGFGGTYMSGYLGALIRGAYELRLGKKSAVSFNVGYRPAAAAFIPNNKNVNIVGMEYGMGVGFLF